MRASIVAIAAGVSLILAACGGGGGDGGGSSVAASATPNPAPATGQYAGTINGRQATVLVMDDGRSYTKYSVAGQPTVIAGVVAGTVSSSSGNLSGTGIDYNLEGQGANSVTVTGTYAAKQSMKATVAYPNGVESDFSGNYDSSYDAVPSQAAVTGTFSGQSATNLNILGGVSRANVTLTVDAAGNITGISPYCSFTGTIKPHATGNVYDITLTFGTGLECAFPVNTSASGIGVLSGNQILAFVQTPSKGDVMFVGSK
ncbi:hypothetical protein OKW40_003657 [Paraburkholderia sp. RAU6.4a]|uniref:hypothetical protein n=1 Tax=Paraburkholderia sp. RAU6.4a TaxID=2991067 RepID=UPI003D1BAEE5